MANDVNYNMAAPCSVISQFWRYTPPTIIDQAMDYYYEIINGMQIGKNSKAKNNIQFFCLICMELISYQLNQ